MKNKKRIKILEEQVELILELLLGEEEAVAKEEQDFEVGKWYKHYCGIILYSGVIKANKGYWNEKWREDITCSQIEEWQLATHEEIKEVLTKRCKELGLFDGEFKCLTGKNLVSQPTNTIHYWKEDDKLWLGNKLVYEKGKFAEKRITSTSKTEKEFIFKESELRELEVYVQGLNEMNLSHYKELILQFLRSKR